MLARDNLSIHCNNLIGRAFAQAAASMQRTTTTWKHSCIYTYIQTLNKAPSAVIYNRSAHIVNGYLSYSYRDIKVGSTHKRPKIHIKRTKGMNCAKKQSFQAYAIAIQAKHMKRALGC